MIKTIPDLRNVLYIDDQENFLSGVDNAFQNILLLKKTHLSNDVHRSEFLRIDSKKLI
jgi:hypothetical protein